MVQCWSDLSEIATEHYKHNHSTLRQGSGTIAVSSDHSDMATRRAELLEVLIMLLKGLVEFPTMTAVQLVLQVVVSRSHSNIKQLP